MVRHVLRNYVYLHAIENDLPLPIGTQDAEMLDTRFTDEDLNQAVGSEADASDEDDLMMTDTEPISSWDRSAFKRRAAEIYDEYQKRYKSRFGWIRSGLFDKSLENVLRSDSSQLIKILQLNGTWEPSQDAKLTALYELIAKTHPSQKVLIF